MSFLRNSLFSPPPERTVSVPSCFAKLNQIRANDDTQRGRCLPCAFETVKAMISPQNYIPTVINADNANLEVDQRSDLEDKSITFKATKSTHIHKLLIYLKNNEQKPGSVYLTRSEDHAYVLFKSSNNVIYLLDSDAHYYCRIDTENDFKADASLILKPNDLSEIKLREEDIYNYFYDNEGGEISLTLMGVAHDSWEEVLKPIEGTESLKYALSFQK